MRDRLPSFKALQAFAATARLGRLSDAARELNVTPGAVSRQISSLEQELGRSLMRRGPQGAELTEQGRALARRLEAAFSDIAGAVRDARREPDAARVTLRAYPTFAIHWLMPRLAEFHAENPGLDLRVHTSVDPPRFDAEDIDLAVMIVRTPPPTLRSAPLFSRLYTPVCNQDLMNRWPTPLPLAALETERLLVSEMHRDHWRRWLGDVGLPPELVTRGILFGSSSLAWQAAREGAGFAMGQEALLRSDLASGRLHRPFDATLLDDRRYWIVARQAGGPASAIDDAFAWIVRQADAPDSG